MSTSGFSAPLFVKRTFAVSVFPLRRNSVTSAVMPDQFVSCDASAPVDGTVDIGAAAAAVVAVVTGAGALAVVCADVVEVVVSCALVQNINSRVAAATIVSLTSILLLQRPNEYIAFDAARAATRWNRD